MKFSFFKKKDNETSKDTRLNEIYTNLKNSYPQVSEERQKELSDLINKYGYLPYPYIKALEELTPEEILFGLEIKWNNNKIFENGKFNFKNDEISVLARNHVKNSSWIQKEGHDIKLINLAGLGNGNKTSETGKFIDWLRQLLILPTGNLENGIFNTTIYLIPFHPREFGCAYLPKSSEISEKLFDENIQKITGMDAKEQVQTFITLSQLAGHPVIYDILPQTGRFSKSVLANPKIARWYDINLLNSELDKNIDRIAKNMPESFDDEDIELVKNIYKDGCSGELSSHFKNIYDTFDSLMNEAKKDLSNAMMKKANQEKLQKRAKTIVDRVHNFKSNQKLTEEDITKQIDTIQELIKKGLWPAPGGAWCSAGVPIYDKMSECGGYPTFKHYDYKGEDVTSFANLDCQTPYYFCYLENGTFNKPVIEYFVNYMVNLQKEYNFDGFRVDHIDHIVDKVSETHGKPISYRAPRVVLNKLNKTMKSHIPYFGTLAEYMLWDDYLKEYHKGMNFDLLWGNDIVSQCEKTPEKIMQDNQHLYNYNVNFKKGEKLSILKTYNNQDGEFRCINQYPGQLSENGALYKWFKYKFLPGGKFAQRPMLYVDGDESFTKNGIEHVIGEEVSMKRENCYDFYRKFNAIDVFVKNNPIISGGEAQIITQDDDGFAVWIISKVPDRTSFLVVSNSKYTTELVTMFDENNNSYSEIMHGEPVFDKTINLPSDFSITKEYYIDGDEFVSIPFDTETSTLHFDKLEASEFRVYELKRVI
jgi:hypothetical protein